MYRGQVKLFAYVDDFIMCSRGEYSSVLSLLQGFKHFSEVSSLEARPSVEIYTD